MSDAARSKLTTKYYTVSLCVQTLQFSGPEALAAQLGSFKRVPACLIMVVDTSATEGLVKGLLAANEKFDFEAAILFFAKSGDSKRDEEFEGRLNKAVCPPLQSRRTIDVRLCRREDRGTDGRTA